jgi:hypothetical protein
MPQDMRGGSGYPVASASLLWSRPGAGVHVEHPTAERHGPLPLVCYAFAADATGYPLPPVTHHVRIQSWAIPELGPPEAQLLIVSLGISLPCQVPPADLPIACTAARHR